MIAKHRNMDNNNNSTVSNSKSKFLVCSYRSLPPRVAFDPIFAESPLSAKTSVHHLRKHSDVLFALTAAQLRQLADQLEQLTPKSIEEVNKLASMEEESSSSSSSS